MVREELSGREVARRTGVSQPTVCKFLNGDPVLGTSATAIHDRLVLKRD